VGDPKQPTREPTRGVEGRQVAIGLQKRFLGKIFGQRTIADDARDERDDRTLITPDDLLECGLRPRQRLRDEPGLGYRLEIDRDVGGL
jgi:hypothetical protein